MNFTCTVNISKPIAEVVELWKNEAYFHKWQSGFVSKDLIEGKDGEIGAKSQIVLEQGGKKMELTETILENELPYIYKSLVEHVHMDNTQTVRFIEVSPNETCYETEIKYTEFKHFIPRILAKLFPGMFKKQVQKWLDQFKAFAENG